MWRSFFLAIGISLLILGGEFMVVERLVLAGSPQAPPAPATQLANYSTASPPAAKRRSYEPPEAMPWMLLSTGMVVILYSFTIPRRVSS